LQGLEYNFSKFLQKNLTLFVICRLIYPYDCGIIPLAHSEGKPFVYLETTSRIRWQAEKPASYPVFYVGAAAVLSGTDVIAVLL